MLTKNTRKQKTISLIRLGKVCDVAKLNIIDSSLTCGSFVFD
jgi:hypothetical protein